MKLKIRINELARELEVKPNVILDLLPEFGVDEKKTHSSSIDEDVAIAIKHRLGFTGNSSYTAPARSARESGDDDGHVAVAVESRTESSRPAPQRDGAASRPQSASPDANAAKAGSADDAQNQSAAGAGDQKGSDQDSSSVARPRSQPLRPPLAGLRPPLASKPPAQAAPPTPPPPPAPPVQAAPPPAAATPAPPAPPAPAAPAPPAQQAGPGIPAERPAGPRAPLAPSTPPRPAGPGAPQPPAAAPGQPRVIPARDVPIFRPGQVISGPRQPLPPPAPGERPPAEARPPMAPGVPRPAAPGAPRPPQPRGSSGMPVGGPRAPQGERPQGPPPGAPHPNRPTLVGQPAARPVVPPRPDLVERIRQQTRPAPGAPAAPSPRPGMPQQRPGGPAPGQPIFGRGPGGPGGPGRPGAFGRGPGGPGGRPGGPGGPGGLGRRPMHPTSPLRPEPATPPPTDTRRPQAKKNLSPEQRKREAEGKLREPIRSRQAPLPVVNKEITIGEGITVKELAEKLGVKSSLVVKQLFDRKIMVTVNQTIDLKLAEELAREFGATTSTLSFEEEATWGVELAENEQDVEPRAPVVTVMGHVDHGKTSLLDAIRSTTVADREAGGITQHIGASVVENNGQKIVFIDTPGHEAFTRMRARGAKVTDIVILVVAADDGVMPQTVEAIDHARAAKVPIIVAINKVDKPDANIERIKQQLADRNLLAEDWGGDVPMVPVSAKAHQNIDYLLEIILLVAEMQNLKANRTRPGVGSVLEAQLDRGRGPVATVLVQNGTLKVGDYFICGAVFSKVRAMYDHQGQQVREAGPSTPVEVIGLDSLPEVGDAFQVVSDTAKAKQIVLYREAKTREQQMSRGARLTLEQFHEQAREGDIKDLNVIIKTDVGGTAEVLSEMLQKLSTDKVRIRVIAKNVGAITESDVLLATASNAIVIGFNVRPERTAAALAEKEKIDIRLHTIIYELTDEIKKAMAGMLDPVFKEVFRGRADVREVFFISKVGTVAGCYITEGLFNRDSQLRILRDNIVIHTGKVDSLRRFKNDVSEVKAGFECGVVVTNFRDIKQGDVLEAFAMERVAPDLNG